MARRADPEAEATDNAAVAALDGVEAPATHDAWDGEDAAQAGSDVLTMGATLQDVKISAASNGNTYTITVEVGMEYFQSLADLMGPTGVIATWQKVLVGSGAIHRIAGTTDADGSPHAKVVLQFPQSEVSRSAGYLSTLVGTTGRFGIERMQQTLRLASGEDVDLTARAE